jgi:DNA-binding CsgD family transcriptional regulator
LSELERGREHYASGAWLDAHRCLSLADQAGPLAPQDLELLARSAYMLGRGDDYVGVLERAHHLHLNGGEVERAVRCAFWIGLACMLKEEASRATGWFSRAERLLERDGRDCVERGYLLIPVLLRQVAGGDSESAYATGAEAAEIGERFGDRDLTALVVQEQGHALVRLGRVDEGLRLLDETMVAVVAGELSPIVTGLVYCNTIAFCQSVLEVRRAREWTVALSQWCEQQPDMVAHTGLCLVHRAEIMQLNGAWPDALEEAQRAGRRLAQTLASAAAGRASYCLGDVHRLRGNFAEAERAYRDAGRSGCEPQPGLALLRLAQGNADAAAAGIRRATAETGDALRRATLLDAYVDIMLAVGEPDEAREASRELAEIAQGRRNSVLDAMVSHARGAIALDRGDARAALVALRRAWRTWHELDAPYEAARVRVLVGRACRALGDEDAAALELEAARGVFEELGAAPALARLGSPAESRPATEVHGLTPRELQVLRLVAAGATNKAIAAELVLSERTVDRHVSNIFAKLRVPSRAAATAYAYQHALV